MNSFEKFKKWSEKAKKTQAYKDEVVILELEEQVYKLRKIRNAMRKQIKSLNKWNGWLHEWLHDALRREYHCSSCKGVISWHRDGAGVLHESDDKYVKSVGILYPLKKERHYVSRL